MISAVGVTKIFGEHVVLDRVTFDVAAGEVVGLVGLNGAGKTTTFRILSTLLAPTSGSAVVAGHDVVADADAVRRAIGVVVDDPGLDPLLTPREQLRFSATIRGLPVAVVDDRVRELGALLRLEEHLDVRAAKLSRGTKQKVAVCRALLHRPKVLLLDEPTSGLDALASSALEDAVRSERALGTTIVYCTHRLEEVGRIADRIIGIDHGSVFIDATPRDLRARHRTRDLRRAFIAALADTEAGR